MNKIITILFLTLFMSLSFSIHAQSALRIAQFNIKKGVAIQGYDPVAYFTESKAVKGKKENAVMAEGITYYFSTIENKEKFKNNYKIYEPEYGGWCAYAMGDSGEKVEIDPETFKVVSGKLYLFYNKFFTNTLTKWNKDETNLKGNADKNWTSVFFK